MNVTVLTPIPSPYQVEMFDALAQGGGVRPRVVYLRRTSPSRRWAPPSPAHDHLFLSDGGAAAAIAAEWVTSTDLFVAAWYADSAARTLIDTRVVTGRPWCFWGERPGFAGWGVFGRLRRRWRLSALRNSEAPIWGIGSWAVAAWKREFGEHRRYCNLPYFSDLTRFTPPTDLRLARNGEIRFLFSGSLIKRKGVDLLSRVFSRLASTHPHVRVEIVGVGELEPILRSQLSVLGERVTFSGFVQWADLPTAYHRADVLVAPSRYDGWGLIVPEGLAAGLPVIGTDRTGAAIDLIENRVNGWRIPAGDVASLSRVVAEAADLSPAELHRMSAAARYSVGKHSLEEGAKRFAAATHAALQGWAA